MDAFGLTGDIFSEEKVVPLKRKKKSPIMSKHQLVSVLSFYERSSEIYLDRTPGWFFKGFGLEKGESSGVFDKFAFYLYLSQRENLSRDNFGRPNFFCIQL